MTEKETPESKEPVTLREVPELREIQVRDNIVLRQLKAEDGPRIVEILDADPTIRDRVSVAAKIHTPEDVALEVLNYQGDPHLIRYALTEGDEVIGLMSLWRDVDSPFDAPDNPDDYGFGYFIDPAARGKGIVTDALGNLLETADTALNPRQFIAYCEDDNTDSISVLRKIGFEPTDTILTEENSGWTERKYVKESN